MREGLHILASEKSGGEVVDPFPLHFVPPDLDGAADGKPREHQGVNGIVVRRHRLQTLEIRSMPNLEGLVPRCQVDEGMVLR